VDSIVFSCSYGSVLYHFRDIQRRVTASLEFAVSGYSTALKFASVDR